MARRIARLCLLATFVAVPAAAQVPAPKLTKIQREALHAVVSAVDAASAAAETTDSAWQMHTLRASDGSHYVAFSAAPPSTWLPTTPVILYVRLASRLTGSTIGTERSAVLDWLNGLRRDPLPLRPARVIAVASGELPIGGTLGMSTRGAGVGQSSAALAMIGREAERAKAQQEERERQRRAALEGAKAPAQLALYPFEDFDLAATAVHEAEASPLLRRSFTAGPGEYDLYLGWIDASDKAAVARVIKRTIALPAAHASGLALSTVIVADAVGVRETPYPSDQQTAHPYAIGATDITPARDDVFSSAERLAIVFQVINPQADVSGKPDVSIAFRLYRVTAAGDESVGVLNPQSHNAGTLPVDFDLSKGHPVFAAVAVPLARLGRGPYRLRITASDRLAGSSTTSDAAFRIVGTPSDLLRSAPSLGAPFARDAVLAPTILSPVVHALRPAAPSEALRALLDAATERRFTDALRDAALSADEQPTQALVRAIALYALGDAAPTIAVQLQQALARGAPAAPTHVFLGACRALTGDDRDAALSWQAAVDAGLAASELRPLLVDAYLRQGDPARALGIATADDESASWARGRAAALVALARDGEALPAIDRRLADQPDDRDAQWLLLHALFAQFVRRDGIGATPDGQARFRRVAASYIDARSVNAALAAEWVAAMSEGRP